MRHGEIARQQRASAAGEEVEGSFAEAHISRHM